MGIVGTSLPLTIPPTVANWTWVNQEAATAVETNGGIALTAPIQTGDDWRLLVRAAPSTPYTITAGILSNLMPVDYAGLGIGWRQSSDGKMVSYEVNGANQYASVIKFNSETSWNGTYVDRPLKAGRNLFWLRITDDGTDRKCWISVDKCTWLELHSVGRTDFLTADQVWFGVQSNNGTYPISGTLISWEEA